MSIRTFNEPLGRGRTGRLELCDHYNRILLITIVDKRDASSSAVHGAIRDIDETQHKTLMGRVSEEKDVSTSEDLTFRLTYILICLR